MSNPSPFKEAEEAEVSMQQAFATALEDDNFHDVSLEGTDGVRVPAVRNLLALRSKVFGKMLYGSFQEANQDVVKVDYPSTVVKAIVEYIHTNTADILVEPSIATDKEPEPSESIRDKFQTLITLTMAAAYYNLPKLCQKVNKCLSSYMDSFPSLSCEVLEACVQEGPAIPEQLKQAGTWKFMSLPFGGSNSNHCLKTLTASALELALYGAHHLCMSQLDRFELINAWSKNSKGRQPLAKKMVKNHVELQLIDPDILSTKVTSSGLVTLEQLCYAYQHQAKRAKHEHKMSFDNSKKVVSKPTWKTTNSPLFHAEQDWEGDVLQHVTLTNNHSYQWTVRILGTASDETPVWLGVVSTRTANSAEFLDFCGARKRTWGITGYEGREWSSKKRGNVLDDAKFGAGSSVVVTLDLSTEEAYNGSLSISVDGKPSVLVCHDMRSKLIGIGGGFVPALSLCLGGTATIVNLVKF